MARLREGWANTARGAAHFLRETVGRVRYAGANGRLTLRADSGFYTHGVVSVCRKMDSVTPSPSASEKPAQSHGDTRRPGRRFLTGWTVPPMWQRDHLHPLPGRGGRRAGTAHRPAGEADARLATGISSPNTVITASSPTGTGSCSNWRLTIAATTRSRMPYATSSTASAEPSPLGPRRQRRLAGRPDRWPTTWPAGRRGSVWESG